MNNVQHELAMNNIRPDIPTMDKVVFANELTLDNLEKLFNNDTQVIRVPNYCDESLCHLLKDAFTNHEKLECYNHEFQDGDEIKYYDYGVDRFGRSFNTTYSGNKEAKEYYYSQANDSIRTLRKACNGQLSPFDKFRLEMDEIWNRGVGIGRFENRKMMSGIVRVMNRPEDSHRIHEQPHIDFLPSHYRELKGQFSVNIYLSVPSEGGELEIWDYPPVNFDQFCELKETDSWRQRLGKPMRIKPMLGELIMFSTRVPHAVTEFSRGPRISIQSFIGLREDYHVEMWA